MFNLDAARIEYLSSPCVVIVDGDKQLIHVYDDEEDAAAECPIISFNFDGSYYDG